MKKTIRWTLLSMFLSLPMFIVSCGSKPCVPGATQRCVCNTGAEGSQSCSVSGTSWEPCQCTTAATDGGPISEIQPEQPDVSSPKHVSEEDARKMTDEIRRLDQANPLEGTGGIVEHYLPFPESYHMGITQGTACDGHSGTLRGSIDFNIAGIYERTNQIKALASAAGEVFKVNIYKTGYGHHVVLRHSDGTFSLYAHLGTVFVQEGTKVCRGQELGIIDSTGHSTGPHLHYEQRKTDYTINPNPTFKELPSPPTACYPCTVTSHTQSACYKSANKLACQSLPTLTYPPNAAVFKVNESVSFAWTLGDTQKNHTIKIRNTDKNATVLERQIGTSTSLSHAFQEEGAYSWSVSYSDSQCPNGTCEATGNFVVRGSSSTNCQSSSTVECGNKGVCVNGTCLDTFSVDGIAKVFDRVASEENVPSCILKAMGEVESNWDQRAVDLNGGKGVMQLTGQSKIDSLAKDLSVNSSLLVENSMRGVYYNIKAAARYMNDLVARSKNTSSPLIYPGEPLDKVETWWFVIVAYNGGGIDGKLTSSNYPYRVFNRYLLSTKVPKISIDLKAFPPSQSYRVATAQEEANYECTRTDKDLQPPVPKDGKCYIRTFQPFDVKKLSKVHSCQGSVATCPTGQKKCSNGSCAICCEDKDCSGTQTCKSGRCEGNCRTDKDCSGNFACQNNQCSSSVCSNGYQLCKSQCISQSGCCGDSDCRGNFACLNNQCSTSVCTTSYKLCNSVCIASAKCCQDSDCSQEKRCQSGTCVSRCAAQQTWCNRQCVDTQKDTSHCGRCSNACKSGFSCQNGRCRCPSGQKDCGGSCSVCCSNNDCNLSQVCQSGRCIGNCRSDQDCKGNFACQNNQCSSSVCSNGYQLCKSQCIANTGCCTDQDCSGNFACQNNQCSTTACIQGYKPCNNRCILNAGCCTDQDCSGNFACQNNQCSGQCVSGYQSCNGQCILSTGCCRDSDCGGNFACQNNQCSSSTCVQGYKLCNNRCIRNSSCCDGQKRNCFYRCPNGTTVTGQETCQSGSWGSCSPSGTCPPSTPTGINGYWNASKKWNYISWNRVSGATQYRLYWGTSNNVTKSSNKMPLTSTTDFGHSGVVQGYTYYYRVAAVNSAGESSLSSTTSVYVPSTTPSTPTGVRAYYDGTKRWNYIYWNRVSGATHYRVYWGTSSGVTKSSNKMPLTSTTDFGHSGVVRGYTYYYRVAAVNSAGESPLSGVVSARVP